MNIKKMSISIIIMILINITFLPKTLAISDIIEDGDNFLNSAGSEEEVVNETKIQEVSSKIYNILLACGIGVAVIVGAGLGIAFIVSSAEGKAKISETLVPYIIGCFVVFGAFTIWKIAINIGNDITQDETADEKLQKARMKNSEYITAIEKGEIKATDIEVEKLKELYRTNYIAEDLKNATEGDPRGGGKGTTKTLKEAVESLSFAKKEIYKACEKNGLLKADGIYLKD